MKCYKSNIFLAITISLCATLLFWGCTTSEEPLSEHVEGNLPDSIFTSGSHYIAVIGDIQEYTYDNKLLWYLSSSLNWLNTQQRTFKNFAGVLQVGDLTWGNLTEQWDFADYALHFLGNELLFIPCTGNHDYTWGSPASAGEITDRNSTHLNQMQGLSVLRKSDLIYYEENKLDNIIVPITIGRTIINLISLEFGPRKEVIEWANKIVSSNPEQKYILMTHEWMTREGERISENSYADMHFPNLSHTNPQEIWEDLVYENNNILCVLCGHNGFCKYLYSENAAKRKVCQILFNLQYQENGGDGMIQLWEFPKDNNVINISVYNTITRKFHSDPETRITINL